MWGGVRRLISLAVAVGLAAGPSACLSDEDDQLQFLEDFEGCGLCDWTVAGPVELVTTNHVAEHAASLGPGAQMRIAVAIDRELRDNGNGNFTDGNWVEYSTDCPAISLGLPWAGEQRPTWFDVRIKLGGARLDGFVRRKLMFPPVALAPIDPDEPQPVEIRFRDLIVESSATCRIDNLRILVSGGILGY